MSQPQESDLVMGGRNHPLKGSLVLGGIDAVKKQLASVDERCRCDALISALKYSEKGENLIIKALEDSSEKVRWIAYRLLMVLSYKSGKQQAFNLISNESAKNENSSLKKALKAYLQEEIGQYSSATIGTDFPLDLLDSRIGMGIKSADAVAVFPSGYMLALIIIEKPIGGKKLLLIKRRLRMMGIDVMWCLRGSGNNVVNKKEISMCYDFAYILTEKTIPIGKESWNTEVEIGRINGYRIKGLEDWIGYINRRISAPCEEWWREELIERKLEAEERLRNGDRVDDFGASILKRAIRVTFIAWRRLTNAQLKRGVLIQNKGVRSFGGILGSLANEKYTSKVAAIAKTPDNYWIVTEEREFLGWGYNDCRLCPDGIQAIKERAHTIAKIKRASLSTDAGTSPRSS